MRPFFMEKLRRKYHLCQKLKLDQKNLSNITEDSPEKG